MVKTQFELERFPLLSIRITSTRPDTRSCPLGQTSAQFLAHRSENQKNKLKNILIFSIQRRIFLCSSIAALMLPSNSSLDSCHAWNIRATRRQLSSGANGSVACPVYQLGVRATSSRTNCDAIGNSISLTVRVYCVSLRGSRKVPIQPPGFDRKVSRKTIVIILRAFYLVWALPTDFRAHWVYVYMLWKSQEEEEEAHREK